MILLFMAIFVGVPLICKCMEWWMDLLVPIREADSLASPTGGK